MSALLAGLPETALDGMRRNDEVAGRRSLGKKAVLDCRLNGLEHPLSAAGTNLPGAVVDRTWDEGDVADLERRVAVGPVLAVGQ